MVLSEDKYRSSQNRSIRLIIWIAVFLWFLHPCWTNAQTTEEADTDTILEGFEEEAASPGDNNLEEIIQGFEDDAPNPQAQEAPKTETKPKSPLSLDGYFKLGATWNFAHKAPRAGETDWRGLSRLRPETQLDLLLKWNENWRALVSGKAFYDLAYTIKGRDEFTDEVLDQYEQEAEWREVFLQGRLSRHVDIKTGRQIVVWGQSDNIRITDVLNPLDMREPGMVDIEDLRLPVTMTRLDGYWASWNLTAIAVHEIRFNKNPVYGSDFFPDSDPLPPEDAPACGSGNTEWALALNGIFSGKDISFYWADIFNDNAHGTLGSSGSPIGKHARITLYGMAGNLAWGNWLFISEAAYIDGLKFFHGGNQTFERLDALFGAEYSGWNQTQITLDWAIRHLTDFNEQLNAAPDYAQEDEFQSALRISQDYLNDTLNFTLLSIAYGPLGQDGALGRFSVEYDWNDALSIQIGVVVYQSGKNLAFKTLGIMIACSLKSSIVFKSRRVRQVVLATHWTPSLQKPEGRKDGIKSTRSTS